MSADQLIVSSSGCYFEGQRLVHTSNCACDQDYMDIDDQGWE